MEKIRDYKDLLNKVSEYKSKIEVRQNPEKFNNGIIEERHILICGGPGCKASRADKIEEKFKEEIERFIVKSSNDSARRHFLICNNKNSIIGECVLMDIDAEYKSCSYRIAIFNKTNFNKGIGYKATKEVLKYAFKNLKLHRIELEVFDYNPRAKAMYEKCGFKEEGIKRDALFINEEFHNIYIMSILSYEFMEG